MITVNHVTDAGSIPIDRDTWNTMVTQNTTNTVFQTYEWFHSWWNTYGDFYDLIFLLAYENDELVGFVPLMSSRTKLYSRSIEFAGDNNADYCDFVTIKDRENIIAAFIGHLYSISESWNQLYLINIPDYSGTLESLKAAADSLDLHLVEKAPVSAPTIILDSHESETLANMNKYSIMRHVKKLDGIGSIQFEYFCDKTTVTGHLEDFFEQHIRRYKLKKLRSQFVSNINRDFFYSLIDNFEGTDWVFMAMLKLDGAPLAYHIGFDYENKIFWYKPTFNIDYRKYSPGTVLIRELTAYAVEHNKFELDFTIGDEPFKNRFSNLVRHNHNVVIYRSRFKYLISSVGHSIVGFMRNIRS